MELKTYHIDKYRHRIENVRYIVGVSFKLRFALKLMPQKFPSWKQN